MRAFESLQDYSVVYENVSERERERERESKSERENAETF